MQGWSVYDFLDNRNQSTIRAWLESNKVPPDQVAAFRAKIDTLKFGGPIAPGLIEGPIKKKKLAINGIYKMTISGHKGWVQLRPLLCYGPLPDDNMKTTVTFLLGAIEENWELQPEDHLERADKNREVLKNEPSRRRILRIPRGAKG